MSSHWVVGWKEKGSAFKDMEIRNVEIWSGERAWERIDKDRRVCRYQSAETMVDALVLSASSFWSDWEGRYVDGKPYD